MALLTRRKLVASALALFGATAVAVSSRADRTLVVADAESDDRLLEIPVDQGDEVVIAYEHSVQKVPIEDVYVVDGSSLRADRSVFHSFGAGLPTEGVERTDEGYVVEGDGTYEELLVAPGAVAGHELVVASERYDLVAAASGSVALFLTDRDLADRLSDRGNAMRTIRNDGQTTGNGVTDTNV